MKDAYSFDVDKAAMLKSYQAMYDAYARIFSRMGLKFRAVAADTGPDRRQRVARVPGARRFGRGRDRVVSRRPTTRRTSSSPKRSRSRRRAPPPSEPMQKVPTPGKETCEDVAQLLGLPLSRTVKCIMLAAEAEGRAAAHPDAAHPRRSRVERDQGDARFPASRNSAGRAKPRSSRRPAASPATSGPVGIPAGPAAHRRPHGGRDGRLRLRRQRAAISTCAASISAAIAASRTAWPTSATSSPATRRPTARERSKSCAASRSGHVFALGDLYSKAMGATYLDAGGQSRAMEMGCYGIGITRVVAAAIEQNHDAKGIIWPPAAGPFCRGDRPGGVRSQRGGQGAGRLAARRRSRRPASKCCSTTGASVLA